MLTMSSTMRRAAIALIGVFAAGALAPPDAPANGDQKAADPALTAAQIDQMLAVKWADAGLTPSASASDLDFLRRVTLDLTGTLPDFEHAERFLADTSPYKRRTEVERLLATEDFSDYWAQVLERAFTGRPAQGQRLNRRSFRDYLSGAIREGMPYDQLCRDLLLATGDGPDVGATGFLLRYEAKAGDVAGAVSRTMMGIQIQCAQCHDHPYESWKTRDFTDMAAFFGRTGMRPIREPDPRDPKVMRVVGYGIADLEKGGQAGYGAMGRTSGDMKKLDKLRNNPRARARMQKQVDKRMKELADKNPEAAERFGFATSMPRALGDPRPISLKDRTRREAFAAWLTAADNPYFAKTSANRIWSALFGRGIVNPIDDFSPRNPPSHPALLDALAKEFQRSNYDLRGLLRLLTNTRAYQLSSIPSEDNEGDSELYSRTQTGPLSAEQILASVFTTTAVLDGKPMLKKRRDFMQRLQERILQGFILTFDNDEGDAADTFSGSVPQALLMLNGDLTNSTANPLISGLKPLPNSTIGRILTGRGDAAAKIRKIYLAVLVREPSAAESARCTRYIEESGGGVAAYQDIFWALMNTTEYIVSR